MDRKKDSGLADGMKECGLLAWDGVLEVMGFSMGRGAWRDVIAS